MTLAIDFDGVIHDQAHPKPGRKMGEPLPGAKEALESFQRQGHYVIIHSCNRLSVISDWMAYYEIPYNTIWQAPGKPIADWYIDDRAMEFKGDWQEVLRKVNS